MGGVLSNEHDVNSSEVKIVRTFSKKLNVAPPMTTRTETNTKFFAPVLHDLGNTSLFDEEDEMNMSMESGVIPRFNPESPKFRLSPLVKNTPIGLTEEAVMEVDEDEETKI